MSNLSDMSDTAADAEGPEQGKTHFGFKDVDEQAKEGLVREVFDSVADRYDIMNDVMSAGIHRAWKNSLINSLNPRPGMHLLDVAGGTGDISFRFLDACAGGYASVCDINAEMLRVGRRRAIERGYDGASEFICGNAEQLPVPDKSVDAYTIAFGIRNVTHIDRALQEAYRVLKPGGQFLCLEFSPAVVPLLRGAYEQYSFHVIPRMGGLITQDKDSYQYLVESIRKFPEPERFKSMIQDAGFEQVSYRIMSAGVVALHRGWRL